MKDLKTKLRKFLPTIRDAKEKGLNEADTRMRIRLLLADVLGYDLLEDITQEDMIQSHFVDMTVKAKLWDSKLKKYEPRTVFFIEAKSIETTLRQTHAYQAVNYAATAGVELVLLTNLVEYQLFHISWKEKAVSPTLVLSFNILDDDINIVVQKIQLLSKQSFKKGEIYKYLKDATTLNDKNLLIALMSPRVLSAIRNSLKDITGHRLKEDDQVIKRIRKLFDDDDLYDEARTLISKYWKPTNRSPKKKKTEITPAPPETQQ